MRYTEGLLCAALLFLHTMQTGAASGTGQGTALSSSPPMPPIQETLPALAAQQLFTEAYAAYCIAKQSQNPAEGSLHYAAAIRAISEACASTLGNVECLLLAAQIYRGKGGLSYAKNYFARAERILRQRLEDAPDDIHANLDYAIACLAGEGRFQDAHRKAGEACLRHAIRLAEEAGGEARADGAVLRALAIAALLDGQTERGEKLLAQAAETGTASRFYNQLYLDTVRQGKWIWPVGKNDALREFLVYFLLDTGRNNGV